MNKNKLLFFILLILFIVTMSYYIHYINFISTITLPNFSIKILEQYGDWNIEQIKLCYIPVSEQVVGIMDFLSGNEIIKKMKNKGYTQPTHVYFTITLINPSNKEETESIIVEKNETIYIFKESEKAKYQIIASDSLNIKCKSVNLNLANIEPKFTLSQLIEDTKNLMKDDFYIYDCSDKNCQKLALNVLDILKDKHLNVEIDFNQEINNYDIFQPSEEILNEFPTTKKIAKTLTDILRIVTFFKETSI